MRTRLPCSQVHPLGLSNIGLLELSKFFGKRNIVDGERDFEVEPQAARIHVEGTKQTELAIDRHALGMEKASVIERDRHATV